MYNQTASASAYCMHNATNATNATKVICITNNQTEYKYQMPEYLPEYLPEYSMDVSLFSYMYTLFLAFGCYSILNPVSARIYALKTIVGLAKYTITGYGLFKEYVYKPYVKHIHPELLRLLHIDDGINEIVVIKNGKVIHSFKTMELFVKNNPIKFVKEFSDDVDTEEEEEQEQEQPTQDNANSVEDLSDKVDYNKKCEQLNELIEAFKLHTLDDKPSEPEPEPKQEPEQEPVLSSTQEESAESEDTDKTHEEIDNTPDDYILDPTAYDFIIRNFYYEDEKTGETCSYVFKYDIYYKSEMHEKYDVTMVKDKYFSNRKFIGISLKQNGQKYNINLTTPNNYYVSDNSILNYSFMKWYMMKHYHVNLSNDYLISCIDNYVEMYKINPGKKIFIHKNQFKIVDDETFVKDDKDADADADAAADADIQDKGDTETDAETDAEHETNAEHETDTKNQKEKNKNECANTHLEDNHEMCDIEILDYD